MDSPEFWNDFAPDYAAIQRESRLPVETDVVNWVADNWPLANTTVLDIAAGSGRYALPLAKSARRVTLVDWSAAMLDEANRWLTENGITNFTTLVSDWHELTQPADVVFISQLPTFTPTDLPLFEALARQRVVLNLQTEQHDRVLAAMARQLNEAPTATPQFNPARTRAIQAALAGRAVQSTTFSYQLEQETTITELLPVFNRPFALREAQALAAAVTGTADSNRVISTTVRYTFTVLSWAPPK